VVAAGAGVHRADEHHLGRERHRALRPADHHRAVLQRLAQHFQAILAELGQLVEEQHAAVRQRDLTRARPASPADEPGVRDGVVRGAEGALAHQRRFGGQQAGHGVDLGRLQRLLDAHRGQDRGQRAGQQGLAGAGRSAE